MKGEIRNVKIEDLNIPVLSAEDIEKYNKSISYIHIYKCVDQKCKLEFAIFSWEVDWPEKFRPFCPECGKQNAFNLRSIERKRKISEIVYSENLGNE